jgi:ABC-type Zn2+ transport system substrate-binding protein/surface adhesin
MLIFRHYADHHYPPNNDHHYPPNYDHHYPPNNDDHHHQLAATRHIWVFYRPHPADSAYSQSVCW